MKSILVILFISFSLVTFGQSDYVVSPNLNKNKQYTKFESVTKFDSINNLTHILDFGKTKLIISGKWLDFNHKDFNDEIIFSHCPVLVNGVTNAILEIGVFDRDSYKNIFRIFSHEDGSKKFLKYSKKIKSEIIKTNKNVEQKYVLHTVKRYSRYNEENKFTCLVLFGEKKDKIYMISLYNIDFQKIGYYEDFMINTFINN
jgi:hypothetical protein